MAKAILTVVREYDTMYNAYKGVQSLKEKVPAQWKVDMCQVQE